MRVALYARVSSARQEQERTIASQVEALHAYAAAHGDEIVPQGVFCDDGFSGARLDRPALDRLRDGAQAHAFEAVLVLSPDRLSRNYAYQVLILEELERWGVSVRFVEQPPLDDPAARLLVQIQGAVAEYERAKIAERNRRGRLFRLRAGEVALSVAPYGYRRVARTPIEPAHLRIEEREAAVVRQIFAWHVEERCALRSIAQRLQVQGISTPKGGQLWTAQTVRGILRNPVYIGSWPVNRTRMADDKTHTRRRRPAEEWIILTVPAIIDPETFGRSQQRHAENRHFSPRHLKEERWLLRGLVHCGLCHHAAVAVRALRADGRYNDYYRCRHTSETLTPCAAPYLRATALDTLVWEEVRHMVCNPAVLRDAVVAGATVSPDAALLATQRAILDRQLQAARNERERLLDAYQGGAIELAELDRRLAGIRLREEQWHTEAVRVDQLQQEAAAEQQLLQRLDLLATRMRHRMDVMAFGERQALLREVLEAVETTPYEVTIYYRIPLPPPPSGPDAHRDSRLSTKLGLRKDRQGRSLDDERAEASLAGDRPAGHRAALAPGARLPIPLTVAGGVAASDH
ncbi:MAG: recombinase family protein, partial [Gemmatimonadetes bacterium]|nr:recombinase family protein [Gemmatimonadota bacterium]